MNLLHRRQTGEQVALAERKAGIFRQCGKQDGVAIYQGQLVAVPLIHKIRLLKEEETPDEPILEADQVTIKDLGMQGGLRRLDPGTRFVVLMERR